MRDRSIIKFTEYADVREVEHYDRTSDKVLLLAPPNAHQRQGLDVTDSQRQVENPQGVERIQAE